MTLAMWLFLVAGVVLILLSVCAHLSGSDEDLVAALAIIGIVCAIIGGIVAWVHYDQQQASYRDTIRVQLSQQGYNVKDVDDDGYTYDGSYYNDYEDGWNAYVTRKGAPNCSGNINVVLRDGKVTVVNDLTC